MFLRSIVTLAICHGSASAMTCGEAYGEIGYLEQRCPKFCKDKDDIQDVSDKPVCEDGDESHRNPDSCGHDDCATFLADIDIAKYNAINSGLASCTGTIANDFSDDALKLHLLGVAVECNLEDSFKLSPPSPDTCFGAYSTWKVFDRRCPNMCDDGIDEYTGKCYNGESPYDPTQCGNDVCEKHLGYMKTRLGKLEQGFMACKDYGGDFIEISEYAGQVENHVKWVAGECGFSYGDLKYDNEDENKCFPINATLLKMAADEGYKPLPCK